MTDNVILTALVIVGAFWLLVLPYFLVAGLLHKWGYHALCRSKCEKALEADAVKAQMVEQWKAGARHGMKGRATFGPEKSTAMATEHSLLPPWPHGASDSDHVAAVKNKYAELRVSFDAIDDPLIAANALAVAAGLVLRNSGATEQALVGVIEICSQFAGVDLADNPRGTPVDTP